MAISSTSPSNPALNTLGAFGNSAATNAGAGARAAGKAGKAAAAGADASDSVDFLNPAGATVSTVKLGPQGAGSHAIDFDVPQNAQGQALTFRVNALNNEAPLDSKAFAFNSSNAVSSANGKLAVELD